MPQADGRFNFTEGELAKMSPEHEANQTGKQMPLYRCHKEVWALKIAALETRRPTIEELERILNDKAGDGDGIGGFITPADPGFAKFSVSDTYMKKHNPQVGGYFVQYKDGYQSFSPAAAFEEGYALIH